MRARFHLLAVIVVNAALGFGAAAHSAAQTNHQSSSPFTHRIDSREEFDRLARVFTDTRFGGIPHVMFAVDRRDDGKIYFIDSNRYRFHKDFINAAYLSLERGQAFYDNNYQSDSRRFILGTLALHAATGKFAFEFWEGDTITAELLGEASRALAAAFFTEVWFKPTSNPQRNAIAALNDRRTRDGREAVKVLSSDESGVQGKYQPLSAGSAIGQLRIVDKVESGVVIDRNQIVIFREVPLRLTRLSGFITLQPTSPLSHVSLLARSWKIPGAHIENADALYAHLEGRYVRLDVTAAGYRIALAEAGEVLERSRDWVRRSDMVTPRADLKYSALADLNRQRATDGNRFGAKSANLGEVAAAGLPGITVPRGFTIPFHHYQEFIRHNGLEQRITSAVEEDRFVHDAVFRRERLAEIRGWIESRPLSARLRAAVLRKVRSEYAGKGLFVRSSTNAEDLPEFSGAGLYTTVPNVRTGRALLQAIKTVWASLWNFEAYEARESFGMNHLAVFPAVLIQEGIEAESAGVAITADPFNPERRGVVYINAKRGLGIRVVEGKRIPEQVIYDFETRGITVLSRSDDDTMLAFDEKGGIKSIRVEAHRAVLTDEMIERLAEAARRIERVFDGRSQDIEWLYRNGRLYIVQSRPYVEEQR